MATHLQTDTNQDELKGRDSR